jgi:hypothetical protein
MRPDTGAPFYLSWQNQIHNASSKTSSFGSMRVLRGSNETPASTVMENDNILLIFSPVFDC